MYYSPSFGMMTPAVKNLIFASVTVFLFQILLAPQLDSFLVWFLPEYYQQLIYGHLTAFDAIFGLVPRLTIHHFFIWQVVTYMFLHGGLFHIFFNMFALWMFGIELERTWGTREFYKYFFLTGVAAGVANVLWNWGSVVPTIGASGAVYGILMAYALFFPDRYVYLYFLFPIKVKYLVLIFGGIEFLSMYNQDGVAHIAHLGGMIAGFLYLRHRYRHWGIGQDFFGNFFKKKPPF